MGMTKQELKDFMDKVNMTKIQPEIDNLRTASKFVKWIFDNVVHDVAPIRNPGFAGAVQAELLSS